MADETGLVPEEAIERAQYAAMGFDSIQDDDRLVDDAYLTEQMGAALEAAAPLILAANAVTEIPDEVVALAWDECIYPRNAVEHPPGPGFLRAIAEINKWLAGRASVLRGEGQTNG